MYFNLYFIFFCLCVTLQSWHKQSIKFSNSGSEACSSLWCLRINFYYDFYYFIRFFSYSVPSTRSFSTRLWIFLRDLACRTTWNDTILVFDLLFVRADALMYTAGHVTRAQASRTHRKQHESIRAPVCSGACEIIIIIIIVVIIIISKKARSRT